MASQRARSVSCVVVLLLMSLSPLVITASADDAILLSTDMQHVVLEPGQSTNVTLTIENNGTSITSYNISVDMGSLSSVWEVVSADTTVSNVCPTWNKTTTLVVRLYEGATVADSGSFTVTATDTSTNASTSHVVQVTVAPSYHPSLASAGSGLVSMAAGSSTNLTFSASNLGSVTDTLLLDVAVEPDLAGWWANHSNTSTNSSGNNSTTSVDVLMYGNSYTSSNNLASVVESIVDADGYDGGVTPLTGGGMVLSQHWQNLNTSGHQWNTTLRSSSWDYVVLQDQSQVPSLPSNDTNWQESKNASVLLSGEIEAEGAEAVLFMTWGRRSGESGTQWHQYNDINQNFTDMQERLVEGYTRYAENITAAGNTVWIAPVGLAFKTVHDAVVADGDDPTSSGNLFYDLYTSDGSHPSLTGSYLAACVLHASLTGDACVGSTDTINLNATTKLALQQAADDTVFNQTSGMSYYPWEVGGTAAFGLGGAVPAGWYLQWADDELSNMAAGASQSVTLSVTVPSDAVPDYYGYRLTVGSTNGNVSSSTVLVVEVEPEPSLALAFLDQSNHFLPGQSTATNVQVTNTGNTELDLDWSISSSNVLCTVSMVDAQTPGLQPTDVADVGVQVDVDASAVRTDVCELTLHAHHDVADTTVMLAELVFTVNIDEAVNFTLSGPQDSVDIVPDVGANYELRVMNHGSDEATFFLDILPSNELQTVLVSASGVTVAAGQTGTWTVNTKGDVTLSGMFNQGFATNYEGQTSTLDVDVLLLEVASFDLAGPGEDRVLLSPGGQASMNITLTNTGTSNLSLSPTLFGLPAGVTASFDQEPVLLERSSSTTMTFTFVASTGATPSTTSVSLSYNGAGLSEAFDFDLLLLDRAEVVANTVQSRLLANPVQVNTMLVDVTNLGTQSDVYVVEWSSEVAGEWFEFTVTPSTFQLSAGSTQTVSIGVREVQQGAPVDGVEYTFNVMSTTDSSSTDSLSVGVEPVGANANLTLLGDVVAAKPGESVFGSILVTNTGNVEDTFSITTVGTDCGLDASVTLAPGLSSDPLGWSCVVSNDAAAGQKAIVFRAVSAVRTNVAIEQAIFYTVEADWPGSALVALSFDEAKASLGVDSSTSVVLTIENMANTEVTGSLSILGQDEGLLLVNWVRMSDQAATNQYTLTPGSSMEFKMTMTSNTARSGAAELVVRATSAGGGVLTSDDSLPLKVTIEGPELPPNGLSLPLGVSVSQPATLGAMGLGWLIAVAAVLRLRRRPAGDEEKSFEEEVLDDEEEPEEDLPELGYNECRLDGESKVNCPTCDARLGVPRGSVPPFRFTCPQCSNKIRVVE